MILQRHMITAVVEHDLILLHVGKVLKFCDWLASKSPTNDLNIVVLERVFLVVHISVLFKRLVH